MKLILRRIANNNDSTLGVLYVKYGDSAQYAHCFTVEDEYRNTKVNGETRIPAGVYEITLRNDGSMTKRYAAKFPNVHKGMLWLRNVPNFEYVYIHIGNTEKDTEGCILVNYGADLQTFTGSKSTDAYLSLYKLVVEQLTVFGNKVFIEVVDEVL